jgi:hypothetical protein
MCLGNVKILKLSILRDGRSLNMSVQAKSHEHWVFLDNFFVILISWFSILENNFGV